MHEAVPTYLTTMVMVRNSSREILFIERSKSWKGITFPGGHVEPGESIVQCAEREIREETGIIIDRIRFKGTIDWYNVVNKERYLVFAFTAEAAGGELISNSEEGRAFFATLESIEESRFSENFTKSLDLFLREDVSELFGTYGDGKDSEFTVF